MSTFNGIGTQFVGECCQEEDGSYIATYWFTILHIPIIPFYSARIHGQYSEEVAMGHSTLTENVCLFSHDCRFVSFYSN